MCRPYSVNALG